MPVAVAVSVPVLVAVSVLVPVLVPTSVPVLVPVSVPSLTPSPLDARRGRFRCGTRYQCCRPCRMTCPQGRKSCPC